MTMVLYCEKSPGQQLIATVYQQISFIPTKRSLQVHQKCEAESSKACVPMIPFPPGFNSHLVLDFTCIFELFCVNKIVLCQLEAQEILPR